MVGKSCVIPTMICIIILCNCPGDSKPFPLWHANPPIPRAEEQFGFTLFSLSLNQIDEGRRVKQQQHFDCVLLV